LSLVILLCTHISIFVALLTALVSVETRCSGPGFEFCWIWSLLEDRRRVCLPSEPPLVPFGGEQIESAVCQGVGFFGRSRGGDSRDAGRPRPCPFFYSHISDGAVMLRFSPPASALLLLCCMGRCLTSSCYPFATSCRVLLSKSFCTQDFPKGDIFCTPLFYSLIFVN